MNNSESNSVNIQKKISITEKEIYKKSVWVKPKYSSFSVLYCFCVFRLDFVLFIGFRLVVGKMQYRVFILFMRRKTVQDPRIEIGKNDVGDSLSYKMCYTAWNNKYAVGERTINQNATNTSKCTYYYVLANVECRMQRGKQIDKTKLRVSRCTTMTKQNYRTAARKTIQKTQDMESNEKIIRDVVH